MINGIIDEAFATERARPGVRHRALADAHAIRRVWGDVVARVADLSA